MKYQTTDENDIKWMADPSGYDVAEVVKKIKAAGKWEQLLQLEADEDGVVDCDALYDRLNHESDEALASVGLHWTEGTATALEVVKAWERENEDEHLKVKYGPDGKTPSGLSLYDYGGSTGVCLEFDYLEEDGCEKTASLGPDEVLDLVSAKANDATHGEWTGTDENSDVFDMWKE